MKLRMLTTMALAAAGIAFAASAGAGGLGGLKDMAGGADLSSAASGSLGNAAGIVEFCFKNNYLSGDAASSVKDQLMGKLGGESESDKDKSDYADGAKGLLKTGDGGSFDLAKMGDLKKSVTKKACSSVLDHAKSFL